MTADIIAATWSVGSDRYLVSYGRLQASLTFGGSHTHTHTHAAAGLDTRLWRKVARSREFSLLVSFT